MAFRPFTVTISHARVVWQSRLGMCSGRGEGAELSGGWPLVLRTPRFSHCRLAHAKLAPSSCFEPFSHDALSFSHHALTVFETQMWDFVYAQFKISFYCRFCPSSSKFAFLILIWPSDMLGRPPGFEIADWINKPSKCLLKTPNETEPRKIPLVKRWFYMAPWFIHLTSFME